MANPHEPGVYGLKDILLTMEALGAELVGVKNLDFAIVPP